MELSCKNIYRVKDYIRFCEVNFWDKNFEKEKKKQEISDK